MTENQRLLCDHSEAQTLAQIKTLVKDVDL